RPRSLRPGRGGARVGGAARTSRRCGQRLLARHAAAARAGARAAASPAPRPLRRTVHGPRRPRRGARGRSPPADRRRRRDRRPRDPRSRSGRRPRDARRPHPRRPLVVGRARLERSARALPGAPVCGKIAAPVNTPRRVSLWREGLLSSCVYTAITAALTYPFSMSPASTTLGLSADTNLLLWLVAWDVHALVTNPLAIFDANIYHPLRYTLAYSENIIGTSLLV